MKTTKTKSSSYEFFAGNVVFAAIFIICACADAYAQNWSASPESCWNLSDPAKMVFDSDSDGTLDSATDKQSDNSSAGLTGAVSLEKRGTGTLTVNGMHSFTGNIDIYGGTYLIGSGTTDQGAARNSQLGDPRTERKITVYTNATLQLARTGVFGAGTAGGDGIKTDVEIRGGTLTLPAKSCTAFGNLLFHNATINANEGADPKWPLFCITGDWLEFSSDTKTPCEIPYNEKGGFFMSRTKPVDVRVPDITGDDTADVTFSAAIVDGWYYDRAHHIPDNWGVKNDDPALDKWHCTTNFIKTGAGTLALNTMGNNFRRDVVVSNGTLKLLAHDPKAGVNVTTCLGLSHEPHTIWVEPGAELEFAKSDNLGQFYNVPTGIAIYVRGGTLKQAEKVVNGLGPLTLENATLEYSGNNGWPTFGFSDVTFKGQTAYTLPTVDGSYFAIGMNGMGNIRVEKIVSDGTFSSDPDVIISSNIHDCQKTWTKDGITYGPRKSTFRKTGPGVLRLDSTENNFSGDVEIAEGVLTLKSKGPSINPVKGPLGNIMAERTITVCGTGELYFGDSDQLSQACSDFVASMVVSNGTVRFKSGTINAWPTVKFYDANLVYDGGKGDAQTGEANIWGLWVFRYPVVFDGTKKLELPSKGNNCAMSLGYSSDFSEEVVENNITNRYGKTEFCVNDMTGDACVDVDIGMNIQSLPRWEVTDHRNPYTNYHYRCGLLKTGPGTLRLGGSFSCPENTRINEGALLFDGTLKEQNPGWRKSVMQVQAGAFLGGSGTVNDVTIEDGGGFTSALGVTDALTIDGAVTLPEGNDVKINIVCTNDLDSIEKYSVSVVKAEKLSGANFIPVYNGGEELSSKFAMKVSVRSGVVCGSIARRRFLITIR